MLDQCNNNMKTDVCLTILVSFSANFHHSVFFLSFNFIRMVQNLLKFGLALVMCTHTHKEVETNE